MTNFILIPDRANKTSLFLIFGVGWGFLDNDAMVMQICAQCSSYSALIASVLNCEPAASRRCYGREILIAESKP